MSFLENQVPLVLEKIDIVDNQLGNFYIVEELLLKRKNAIK
jgi:hypothetical protein